MTNPTHLTLSDVDNIAQLARLSLSPEERELYRRQLSSILDYVHTLNALDTSGIEASFQVLPLPTHWREDVEEDSLPVAASLSNAPDTFDNYFRMPRILEEE